MPIPFIVKSTKGLRLESINRANFWSRMIHGIMMRKANHIWRTIGNQIKGRKILDVGMGAGSVSYFLHKKGYEVISVDIANLSIYEDMRPMIYDGHKLPYRKNEFDTAVIIHVLHHCEDGLEILREAKRVAKKVVFVEDTFRNNLEWFFVSLFDSVTNWELWLHKYRKIEEWRKVIRKNGWKITTSKEWSETGITSPYGRYCLFAIEG